jgi:beta-ureidopropionase
MEGNKENSGLLRALDATTPVRLGVLNALPKGAGNVHSTHVQAKQNDATKKGACDDGSLAGFGTLEDMLVKYLPEKELGEAMRVLYGYNQGERVGSLPLDEEVAQSAKEWDLDVKAFEFKAAEEEMRPPRKVKIGMVQNSIDLPTTESFKDQKQSLIDKIVRIGNLAGQSGVQILCLQEAWNMPFAFCTREKRWCEFAEDLETGQSMVEMKELAKKWSMVIVTTILERDEVHSSTIWNTAVVIGHNGNVIGKHRKNHIPRVNDFNESTYYMEGNTGHPVFETKYAKIGVNICYGRHHTLNWMGFGLNGAEIVFNPSATVGALSEPMWFIEARNAAINNSYFVAAINRVGTEVFPNEFTSGDMKGPHKDFGHFYGSSYVAAPDASRSPSLVRNKDGLLIAECDLNLIQQTRDLWGLQMTGRHEIYADLLARYVKDDFKPQIIRDPTS